MALCVHVPQFVEAHSYPLGTACEDYALWCSVMFPADGIVPQAAFASIGTPLVTLRKHGGAFCRARAPSPE